MDSDRDNNKKIKQRAFTLIDSEFYRSPELSFEARALYTLLKTFNPCYPSYTRLQALTLWSRTTISKYLKELEAKKLLAWEKGNSRKKSNTYTLTDISEGLLTSLKNGLVGILTSPKNGLDDPKLVQKMDQSLVQNLDSKKNNRKNNNNNNNNVVVAKRTSLKPAQRGVIPEFASINNDNLLFILNRVNLEIQKNWLQIYQARGIDWLSNALIQAAAHCKAHNSPNPAATITQYLKREPDPNEVVRLPRANGSYMTKPEKNKLKFDDFISKLENRRGV